MLIEQIAKEARTASFKLPELTADDRAHALRNIKKHLTASAEDIFAANKIDLENAKAESLSAPLYNRLKFDDKKMKSVLDGIDSLLGLPDVVGETVFSRQLMVGLDLYRVTCPIGVLGVIFESRPDALVQIAALCVKSGNAVLLKGGHEAIQTNRALFKCIYQAGIEAHLPEGWAALLESREDVSEMLAQDKMIDLIIPRGSNAFVRYIMDHTHIPVMGHADGICHVFVDESADLDLAVKVCFDSKTQNYSVCNAAETLLVHRAIADKFLPKMKETFDTKNVMIRGNADTRRIIVCEAAEEEDWSTEYLDGIISVKVVDSCEQAIDHINHYGSHHTDCIITTDSASAHTFMQCVDSANVFLNCSTRFSDGFRYGFGAEVGIATGKLHARGPVGVEGLCTYKYKLFGNGQTVSEVSDGKLAFTHVNTNESAPL